MVEHSPQNHRQRGKKHHQLSPFIAAYRIPVETSLLAESIRLVSFPGRALTRWGLKCNSCPLPLAIWCGLVVELDCQGHEDS